MNFLNNISAVLNQSLHERSRYKNVVDPKNNNEITIVSYKKNETPMDSCCITMNEFKEGEQIAKLPCNHYFSKDAIMEWVTKEKAECPICRFKLQSIEVRESNAEEKQPENVSMNENTQENTIVNEFINDSNSLFELINDTDSSLLENINVSSNNEFVNILVNYLARRQNRMQREITQLQENFIQDDADFQQAIFNSLSHENN